MEPPPIMRRLRGGRTDKRTIIFRAVERMLMADPDLSAVEGLQWLAWRGGAEDTMPYTASVCPLISLTYKPLDVDYEAESLYKIAFGTRIECVTAGTCIDDSIDLWGMIENAFVHSRPTLEGKTVQRYLRECVMVTNPGNPQPQPGGLFDFRLGGVGIFGQSPRKADGSYEGSMDLMIASGLLTGRTVKPA